MRRGRLQQPRDQLRKGATVATGAGPPGRCGRWKGGWKREPVEGETFLESIQEVLELEDVSSSSVKRC